MQGPLFALTVHFVKMEKKIKKRFSFLVSLGQQIDNMRVITIFHWLTQWHELIIKYLLLLWIFIKKKNPQKGYIYTFCKIECHFIFTTTCVWKNISFLIQLTPAFAIYFVWGIENNKRNLWFASVFLILGKKNYFRIYHN